MELFEIISEMEEIKANLNKATTVLNEIADQYAAGENLEPLEGGRSLKLEVLDSTDPKDIAMAAWVGDCPHIFTMIQIADDYLLKANSDVKDLYTELSNQHDTERAAVTEVAS